MRNEKDFLRTIAMLGGAIGISFVLLSNWLFILIFIFIGVISAVIINIAMNWGINPFHVFIAEYLLLLFSIFISLYLFSKRPRKY